MPVYSPSNACSSGSLAESLFDALGHEILAEKAAALGRAGSKAEAALGRLREHGREPPADAAAAQDWRSHRATLLKEAADAVYAWFVQRELCGLRRHEAVIRELQIPRQVLVRLGAR